MKRLKCEVKIERFKREVRKAKYYQENPDQTLKSEVRKAKYYEANHDHIVKMKDLVKKKKKVVIARTKLLQYVEKKEKELLMFKMFCLKKIILLFLIQ